MAIVAGVSKNLSSTTSPAVGAKRTLGTQAYIVTLSFFSPSAPLLTFGIYDAQSVRDLTVTCNTDAFEAGFHKTPDARQSNERGQVIGGRANTKIR